MADNLKAKNASLKKAKDAKEDEFYTQLVDIEKEMRHYKAYFKDKVVFCNCDDPYESNFFKYFALNFNSLGLKKLIATSYCGSCIAGDEVNLFENQGTEFLINKKAYKVVMTELKDVTGDGRENLDDVREIIKHRIRYLKGDEQYEAGDFRSNEAIKLLQEADVVCSNPPFSLFREYLAQLINYNKKFIIVANQNAINYKEVFPLLKDNKVWLGYHFGDMSFRVPSYYKPRETRYWVDETGQKWRSLGTICWFTNIDIDKRHEQLDLYKEYNPEEYPKYDNYDAINVSKVSDIPLDYDGIMGVPITFLNKYNPEQFEILGLSQKVGYGLESNKFYDDYVEMRQDGTLTGASGHKTNGNPVMSGKPPKGNFYYNEKTNEYAYSLYARIFIRRKKVTNSEN